MKETGVVRRIDELGRIVIPKEIRKNLRIREGDSVEIYIQDVDNIVLKKHSIFKGVEKDYKILAKTLNESFKNTILITDNDKVISGQGINYSKYENKLLSVNFRNNLLNRRHYHGIVGEIVEKINETYNVYISPLIVQGDLYGSIIVIEDNKVLDEQEKSAIQLISAFFVNSMEV